MLWSVCAGTPLCWWFCSGGPISWRPASYVRLLCGCICGVWPYYQHQQNRITFCPWPSTQGSWSIHTWRSNQICPKPHLLTYLGCVISSDNSFDLEITRRIQSAASAFGALDARVWSQRGIKLATKCKLYRVFVLPCLLYSTETYTLYRRHLKKLTSIQLRHLRSIMGQTWWDRVCNGEVLQKASLESVEAMLVKSQLRWAGHVVRMPDDRLPKAVFYGELTSGKRKRGGHNLRYKDVLKRHLKAADMDVDTWESDAKNRPFWRKKIIDAGNTIERKSKEKYLEGWRKRHPRDPTQNSLHRKWRTADDDDD